MIRSFAVVLTAASLCGSAAAQGNRPMAAEDVTESALVEALTPPPLTRSLRPRAPPKASILITFETGSARLTRPSMQSLDVVAGALNNPRLAERSFTIEGHADRRGRADLNLRLSAARAEAVRDYLVKQHSVPDARLKAVGKGDAEPINESNPAAAENRRVTFVTQ